jgi:hypothetical protein
MPEPGPDLRPLLSAAYASGYKTAIEDVARELEERGHATAANFFRRWIDDGTPAPTDTDTTEET